MRSIGRILGALTLLAVALCASPSLSAPPSITSSTVTFPLPTTLSIDGENNTVSTIDLRALGVVSGSGPLTITDMEVLLNGAPSTDLFVIPFASPAPGNVCLSLISNNFNIDTFPIPPTVVLRFRVRNFNGSAVTPLQSVRAFNGGSIANLVETPAQRQACRDVNTPPVANAGADQSVSDTDRAAGETVRLNGLASSDVNPGTIFTYTWRNAAGTTIATGATPQVRLPDGQNVISLIVTDDSFEPQTNTSQQDSVTITVAAPPPNQPPIANAGPDQTISDTNAQPGEIVTLDGTQSTDADGTIASFQWFLGQTSLGTGARLQATLPDGTNNVTLVVTDDDGATANDTVQIAIAAPVPNQPPIANAGPDQTLSDTNSLPGETVTLDGTQSTDADGTIASFQWFLGQTSLGTGARLQATLPDGTNNVRLVVTDNDGATANDTVQIAVGAPPNQPPNANAGPDQTLSDTDGQPAEVVTLSGTQSSDPDGQITRFEWFLNQTSLGTGATLQTRVPDGANEITLVVTDEDGASASDTVQITVRPPNRPPTANAGPDQTLSDTNTQAGEPVTLDGTQSSDPDGAIASFQWFLGQTLLGTGATLGATLPDGNNAVTLVVTDNNGATASDTVQIAIAGPTPNQPPVADAGPDQTLSDADAQTGETVTLDGTRSADANGTIARYEWLLGQTSLGAGATLQTRLPDGANTVTLVVTDDDGATANDTVLITVAAPPAPNQPPSANAGVDQTLTDTDAQAGENVTLNGTLSSDVDGTIASYQWFLGQTSLGAGATLQARLPDGANTVTLVVTDDDGTTANDTVQITIAAPPAANQPPAANAGVDQTLTDTDAQPGENVTLNGTLSSDVDGTIARYEWLLGQTSLGTGATLQARLPDGANTVTLVVTDDDGATASDALQVLVFAPSVNRAPTANAGPDQLLSDTDGQAGEVVTLNGAESSDPDGGIATYQWFLGEAFLGSGATLQVRLQDGDSIVRLVVADNELATATDTVRITIAAPAENRLPDANAGPDQRLSDTDGQPGEAVTLDGSRSSDPDGTIVSFQWLLGQTVLGTGPTLETRLPDGANVVTLVVTDDDRASASDTLQVSVTAPPQIQKLSDIPNLTRQQREIAVALDGACERVSDLARRGAGLTPDQLDLRRKCNGLQIGNTQEQQVAAIDAVTPDDFSVVRTQTLLFANTQYARVMDRLMALRGGARGLSLAGLNIIVDGNPIPLAELKDLAARILGRGASADEPGGLLNDKWGIWARGNMSFGDGDTLAARPSFEAKQWALIGGIDYRLTERSVLGAALAYGDSSIDFALQEGALDTNSYALSFYGSLYAAKNFYFDAIVNAASSSFAAARNISYADGVGLVTADARGDTNGFTLSAGASAGYDVLIAGLTVSPNIGAFYIDATVDDFTERGAGGLNFIYDQQDFQSLTVNLGLRATYSLNLPWGVMLPHLRVDYVRELEDDSDVFGVRLASDPDGTAAPPILIETANPDPSYWRLAGGFSLQMAHGISGYIEYQRLQGYEAITFQDLSVGLRLQAAF